MLILRMYQPVLLRDETGNIVAVADIQRRRNDIEAGVFSRLGLPFGAQAELSIPARVINASNVVGMSIEKRKIPLYARRYSCRSCQDFAAGKRLAARYRWSNNLGYRYRQTTNVNNASTSGLAGAASGVAMANSFNELIFSATALKRQDPLAFTSTLSYRKTFKKDGIEPGDVYSLTLGATLAASPQTSLSIGIQQSFIGNTRIFNNSIPGTDVISSIFTFGASSIIGKRLFFSTVAGIGLTKNAPDYFISVAIPFRFDVPFKKRGS